MCVVQVFEHFQQPNHGVGLRAFELGVGRSDLSDLGVLRDLSSKKIMLGVLDLGDPKIETVETVAGRIRQGLKYVAADRLVPAPDCGMKYMPREIAFGKLKAMCDAAIMVRREIS